MYLLVKTFVGGKGGRERGKVGRKVSIEMQRCRKKRGKQKNKYISCANQVMRTKLGDNDDLLNGTE